MGIETAEQKKATVSRGFANFRILQVLVSADLKDTATACTAAEQTPAVSTQNNGSLEPLLAKRHYTPTREYIDAVSAEPSPEQN